ncbi:helix-turn-helix domain-containing protein [Hymenobacter artigasi]|uniref:Helix-turn-helix domain-containing protein n=1 Tax=Hymenobacter artigasi TaxID=2719616 RepID=A0ABX1HP18_9BACT|nr:helix-turn-helix domain-containing protein [Hymenobacter artigasi]NKI91570.1 hypothetical protein [Hymenobacter artigasi]
MIPKFKTTVVGVRQLPSNDMVAFLLIPESEWKQIVSRLERLEEAVQQKAQEKDSPPTDEVLNVRQAAALLKVTPAGLRRARRAGRVKGVRINEKEWGFYTSELHRYLNRYNRSDRLG